MESVFNKLNESNKIIDSAIDRTKDDVYNTTYDLQNCWNSGCHIVTAGYSVIEKATKHVKTDESVEGFMKDFSKWIN